MAATIKCDTIQNASSATANITLDTAGNATVGNTLAMGSSFLRNRLINGGFAIDARNAGASQTITAAAALAYTVDRWYAYCTGANVTGQQVAGTSPAKNAYKFTGATSNTLVGFGQRIEQLNAYDLASGAVTFSAYMTASTNTTITWYLYGPSSTADTFGTIASPSVTQIATGTFSVTSTRTQLSATISAATMSGYNKGLELRFVAASGLGNAVTWTIEDCQLEVGNTATPFERRQYGQELALCQRYYYKIPGATTTPIFTGYGVTATLMDGIVPFPTSMRIAPTALSQSGTASDYAVVQDATITCSSVPVFRSATPNSAGTRLTVASGLTVGYGYTARSENANAYLAWSAEL